MIRRVRVPSRVNIIGEHTDYAGGLALPFATEVYLELLIEAQSVGFDGDETVIALWQTAGGYPAKLTINSEIPIGRGMSSSAALCVAIAIGANPSLDKLAICHTAQRLEHQVLGTKCGLLDQMAMVFAKKNHAMLVNFSDLSRTFIPIPPTWRFKLIDSGLTRKLSDTKYNSNADYSAKHVVAENTRVLKAVNADATTLGKLLNESHASLTTLGVSLPEIDELVYSIQTTQGVLGARMMGGGFGGMILALVANDEVLSEAIEVSSSGRLLFEEFD